MTATATAEQLNRVLADATVFYQKVRNFHWTVRGPQFFKLHEAFEDIYTRWADIIDDLAERIMQLEGMPLRTLKEMLEHSSLKEEPTSPAARTMVDQVVADLQTQVAGFVKVAEAADERGDRTTAGMFDDVIAETEKTLWMLRAFLAE